MAGNDPQKLNMIVCFSEDELNYALIAIRYMNYTMGDQDSHALSPEQREKLAEYLQTRKIVRATNK